MATPIPSNDVRFSIEELVAITGATVDGSLSLSAECSGISTDTRQLKKDSLFVALRGESMDGCKFVQQARELGALCAIVPSDAVGDFAPCLRVRDTLEALGAIAQAYQRRVRLVSQIPVLAVGGAAGKTTTKELAACAARALFGEVLSTQGNLNNLIGVPMTLFTLKPEHRAAVIEVGTNSRGEIPRLGQLVEPTVSLVLNVDAEHTEGLGTIEDVADEEGALFAHASKTCVANLDEPYSFARVGLRRDGVQLCTFSAETVDSPQRVSPRTASVQLAHREMRVDGKTVLTLVIAKDLLAEGVPAERSLTFSLLGPGPAIDVAAALAAVLSMSADRVSDSQLHSIFAAISTIEPVPGRLVPRENSQGVLVIDDTYNANPRSVQLSLETASELARLRGGDLHVILGDMLELGELGPSLHTELAPYVLRASCKTFATVGPLTALTARAVLAQQSATQLPGLVLECDTPEVAGESMFPRTKSHDVVLIKGSRGMRTERGIPVFFQDNVRQGDA